MKPCALVAAALVLAACAGGRQHDPERYFVLDPSPAAAVPYAGPSVIVAPTTAASFYGTRQIVFSDAPGTRATYRYSFWTEQPQRVVYEQLSTRLQHPGPAGRILLVTRIEEIYHDSSTAPGAVHVTISARLEDPASGNTLAQRRFSRVTPVATYDARGAVDGMRKALPALLDDLVAWVQAQAAQLAEQAKP